jgi:hypothetical protein
MPSLLVESPFVEPYFLLCLETTMLTEVPGSRTMISSTLQSTAGSEEWEFQSHQGNLRTTSGPKIFHFNLTKLLDYEDNSHHFMKSCI